MSDLSCPVCGSEGLFFYDYTSKYRNFLICPVCTLIYQENSTLPDYRTEKERYEQHRNNPEDQGYTDWLQSFIDRAVIPWYSQGAVLDFGSGPAPVLTGMLDSLGYDVTPYDPYFAPLWPGDKEFSLILMCEVLEHVSDPLKAFKRLYGVACEGAHLSLKTQFLPSQDRVTFHNWWYKEDPTHIRFYTPGSLKMLGDLSGWSLEFHDTASLAVYKKKPDKGEN